MSRKQTDEFRPPWISAAMAGGCGYGAYWCYQMSQAGYDMGTVGALLAGGMALREVVRFMDDSSKLRIFRQRQEQFQTSAKDQGMASFETFKNIKDAGLLADQGIYLGSVKHGRKRHIVRTDSENSGFWLGPPGTGKTAASIIPTMLTHRGTIIVNDPSCEILAVTEHQRQLMGNDTYVLTPSPSRVERIVGRKVNTISMNNYSSIDFSGNPGEVRSEVASRSKQYIPQRQDEDDKSRFFRSDGREILDFIAFYLAFIGEEVTLPKIRQVLLGGPDAMGEMFSKCLNSSSFGGVLAEIANGLLMVKMDAPEQFAGGYGVAKQAIGWADHVSEVGAVLSKSTFDPSRIKDDRPVTIYVCMPGELAEIYQMFGSSVFSHLWRTACNDPRQNTVTCLLEECIGLGYLPLHYALEEGRKHKLRTFCAFQETVGQMEAVYGKAGCKRLLAAAECIWASNVREPESCEMLSRMAGAKPSESIALNDRSSFAGDRPDQTFSKSNSSVRFIRPEDIRTLPREKALVFYQNLQPILLDKCPYFLDRKLNSLAKPNPYYGG